MSISDAKTNGSTSFGTNDTCPSRYAEFTPPMWLLRGAADMYPYNPSDQIQRVQGIPSTCASASGSVSLCVAFPPGHRTKMSEFGPIVFGNWAWYAYCANDEKVPKTPPPGLRIVVHVKRQQACSIPRQCPYAPLVLFMIALAHFAEYNRLTRAAGDSRESLTRRN